MASLQPLLLVRRIEMQNQLQKRQLRGVVTFLNSKLENAITTQPQQQRHGLTRKYCSFVGMRSLASTAGNASTSSISSPPTRADCPIKYRDNPLLLQPAAQFHGQQQRYHRLSSSTSFIRKICTPKSYFHSSTSRCLSASAAEAPPTADTTDADNAAEETKATPTSTNDDGEYEYQDMNEIDWAFTPAPPLSEESQKKVDTIFNEILWLDMVEVHLLTEVVTERMGYGGMDMGDDGGMDMMAGGAGAGGGAGEEETKEEKTIFELKLVGFDAKAKIKVIKEIRSITGLGLKEAKEMVESAPKVVQKDLKKDKAEELKAQLEAIGAQVEIE